MRGPIILTACLLLGACALPPTKLRGDFPQVSPAQASTDKFGGLDVRWGGMVTGGRLTDDGRCLEVAWYPLDSLTFRPTSLMFRPTRESLQFSPNYQPHFLACGGSLSKEDLDYSSGMVTAVGTLESPKVFEVERSTCVATRGGHRPLYSGTIHVSNDEACVVSLPVLKVAEIHAWPDRPSQTGRFGNTCNFCSP